MTKTLKYIFLLPLAVSLNAHSQQAPSPESVSYCRYQQEKAKAEGNLLAWPSLKLSEDLVSSNNGHISDGKRSVWVSSMLLELSPTKIFQAARIKKQAYWDCRKEISQSQIENILEHGEGFDEGNSYLKSLKVLTWGLNQAEKRREAFQKYLDSRSITVVEYYELVKRVENLKDKIRELQNKVEALRALPDVPKVSLNNLISNYQNADDESEKASLSKMKLSTWSFNISGGFEKYSGTGARTNLTGSISLTYNLGGSLYSNSFNEAANYRKNWIKSDFSSPVGRLRNYKEKLESNLKYEKQRLKEVSILEAEIKRRIGVGSDSDSSRARKFSANLWFDWLNYKSEKAFLESHIEALKSFLDADSL